MQLGSRAVKEYGFIDTILNVPCVFALRNELLQLLTSTVESTFPLLESWLSCNLLWEINCGDNDTVCDLSPALGRPSMLSLSLLKPCQLPCKQAGTSLLEDERPSRAERNHPS